MQVASGIHPDRRLPVLGAVLAGGASTRMGSDKRLLPVEGRCMLSRAVDVSVATCRRTVVVVADDAHRVKPGVVPGHVAVVCDLIPGLGPVGGLITALDCSDEPYVLVLAADMPFVEPQLIDLLWRRRAKGGATVSVGPSGREPLLALYHRDCLHACRDMVRCGQRSLQRLFERVPLVELCEDEMRAVDPALRSLINVNTPQAYAQLGGWQSLTPSRRPVGKVRAMIRGVCA